MTFDPNIPQPTDDMSVSQGDLLTNFTDFNNVYGVNGDHVAFNAVSDRGKHTKTTFPSLGAAPVDGSNLTPAEQAYIPATIANELALFTLEEGTDTELYIRKESNGTVSQLTKDNELFVNVIPVFAINFKDLNPNSNIGFGTYNFTVSTSFNLNTATTKRVTASKTQYEFGFTNPVLDSAGVATNNYMFAISGLDNSGDPVIGQVSRNINYNAVVESNFIKIVYVNHRSDVLTQLTGGSVVCWRIQ